MRNVNCVMPRAVGVRSILFCWAILLAFGVSPAVAEPLLTTPANALAKPLDLASADVKSPRRWRLMSCGRSAGDFSCVYDGGEGVRLDAYVAYDPDEPVREIVARVDKEISGSHKLGGTATLHVLAALARIAWPNDKQAAALASNEIVEEALRDGVRGHRRIDGIGVSLSIVGASDNRIYVRREWSR